MNTQTLHTRLYRLPTRAAFFSIDALVALVMVLVMLLFISARLGAIQELDFSTTHDFSIATAALANLEKDGVLANYLISGDSSELAQKLAFMIPSRLCYSITVWDSLRNQQGSFMGPCSATITTVVAYRSFIVNDEIYYARVELSHD